MKLSEAFVLLAAGTLGGIFSTVVSIASLVTYPTLLALGVPPLTANMTNTVSLVLTGAGSVAGSRPELTGQAPRVRKLAVITAAGGVTGAAILLIAPASTFTAIVPVLIGAASLLLLLQPRLTVLTADPAGLTADPAGLTADPAGLTADPAGLTADPAGLTADPASARGNATPDNPARVNPARVNPAHGVALFAVATYVGYFGAAAGVMLLVVLGMMIAEPLVKVNAIKNAVSGAANGMAAICFSIFGSVRWVFVPPLAAGFLIGGWFGPKIARRVPARVLRVLVALCGLGLAIRLGISAYR
jgi:uncharacterized protein